MTAPATVPPATVPSATVPPAFEAYGEEPLPQAPAFGPGKNGVFEGTLVREPGGETRLVRDHTKVPYHLPGTLDTDPAPGLTTLCLQEPTGGVAQGDRHRIDVTARERARALVTTQSATKVHSMHANYAHLDATLTAGPDAHLEYVPGPTIVNEDARCLQTTRVDLAETATVIVADALAPGGLSDHQPFGFDHYHARLDARLVGRSDARGDAGTDGRLVCSDAVDLRPAERDPRDPASVGEFGSIGTLYVLSPSADVDALADDVAARLDRDVTPRSSGAVEAGVSTLAAGSGIVVRVLGERTTDVTATVTDAWDAARGTLLGVGAPDARWGQ